MTTGAADRYDDVSVVMITRNEAAAIRKVIEDAMSALPGAEVFVIDGSDDATPELASQAGATVIREPGGGFGPAMHAALMTPSRPIVATVDADDTYPAHVFPELVSLIRDGWDVAGTDRLGSRRQHSMPFVNWVANQLFSVVASVRARTRLHDVHSGQRAYRAAVVRAFRWDYTGLAFPVDLVLWPALMGFKVCEVPIPYAERLGTTKLNRWKSGTATLRRLVRRRSFVARRYAGSVSKQAAHRSQDPRVL
jgi:glycosyltransferase involved in cell wall biosynthesis